MSIPSTKNAVPPDSSISPSKHAVSPPVTYPSASGLPLHMPPPKLVGYRPPPPYKPTETIQPCPPTDLQRSYSSRPTEKTRTGETVRPDYSYHRSQDTTYHPSSSREDRHSSSTLSSYDHMKDYFKHKSRHSSTPSHYDREKEYYRHRSRSPISRSREYYRHVSSRSPSRESSRYDRERHMMSYSPERRHSRSPSRYSERERHEYERRRDYELRRRYEERRYEERRQDRRISEYDSRREYERRHSPPRDHRDYRSRSRRSPSSHSSRSSRYHSPGRHYSPSRRRPSPRREYSSSKLRSVSRSSFRDPDKPKTDREKILEEYRKNYCKTSEDLMQKMEQWSKEKKTEEETALWYRSSPAEIYYKPIGGSNVEQTPKLQDICNVFMEQLIERGRKARPAVDELPPLKPTRAKMCSHHSGSSSSSDSEDSIDEDGLQGYNDRIMMELQRKQSHPRRLHPEMWFNSTGEMNGGPLCRCSARARRLGMRHGVYAEEGTFPKCTPSQNNIDKLYHYRITVSPPTNFLIKAPTIIAHDEHEFLFSGFSLFSHYKLEKLPICKVIRFNIEYTILYVEEPPPLNFTIQELDLFEDFLFIELLELIDLDLGKATEDKCSQFHFMPRFVRYLADGGCEVLSMSEVLKYLIEESGLLVSPDSLKDVHKMDHYSWQKFVDKIKGMIVTYPGKKPCSIRVDQLDRTPPVSEKDEKYKEIIKTFFPEIVHFGIRPPQLSYAGNPEYQKAWRYYVKYRHLIANMAKPSPEDRQKLAEKEAHLQEMRTQNKMKRDVTVAISSEGFHTTGLMCDVVQHAMLIPVLVRHLRFHKSLNSLENMMGYVFKQRALLQTALTHPSYRENFGTNPDHARNSLTNCGIRQPEYGDRKIHYTRKKGIVTLINIMSRFGRHSETESAIKHNERLEFLGDAVVEFLSSIHLFKMFPGLAEGGLATYRAAIVQNQHLAQLAKNICLEQFMLYAHGSDLCREIVMKHAMANCFEALMGALFLDGGIEVTDRVFGLALWYNEPDLLDVWCKDRGHPLQEQEPLGDRKYIKHFEFLRNLTKFEESIGVQFKHIRLLARAFTDRSVGYTNLTLGSNQRLEFLGDTVLQLLVSDRLYKHFPDHHEGHLSLLRSSLVNNRTQSRVCEDLNMSAYATYNNPKAKPTTKKHKADLLEAFLGALYIDKGLEYCLAFCNACLFPRLQEFILNQDWNDPKSKLQQCCLTLRSMEGGEPDIPLYKVIECLGPTNTRVYTVAVYFRGARLAAAAGHSIQEAEMNAAEAALTQAHGLFPQLDHQKRVIAKNIIQKYKRNFDKEDPKIAVLKRKRLEDKVPKAYRPDNNNSSDECSIEPPTDDENYGLSDKSSDEKSNDDSGLDSDSDTNEQAEKIKVSSLLSDMERIKKELIKTNQYEQLKEKCRRSDSDDD